MQSNPDPRRLARASDPHTSHAAAQLCLRFSGAHQQVIHEALAAHGPMGKTRLAAVTGLDHVAVARRLPELQRQGLVALTGRDAQSEAGRAEREWMAVTS